RDPDWRARLRRAICGIGVVWLVVGATVAVYYRAVDQDGDIMRGLLTMLLGAVALAAGLVMIRRSRP
ncbi:MAG TPA: hypothetical protein VFU98_04385, partial [Microlunatus sp.]|nr:hypothetical protein [Microlunatus sp.]